MANANDELIQRFYAAFDRHDGDAMAACYAPDAEFSDPVFPNLRGKEPGQMWRMLTSRSEDLRVELHEHSAEGDAGHGHWIAHYTFGDTGNKVVNDIQATFHFTPDGLIARHRDDFSFYRWSRQAMGTAGLVLGWTPLLQAVVRRKARGNLDEFIAADK